MASPPLNLRAVTSEGYLEVTWEPGHVGLYPFLKLRGDCPCAGCVDEFTGRRTLDLSRIPDDIRIRGIELVGNYACRIDWSDGHSTGIYTWQRLRELCPCSKCRARPRN